MIIMIPRETVWGIIVLSRTSQILQQLNIFWTKAKCSKNPTPLPPPCLAWITFFVQLWHKFMIINMSSAAFLTPLPPRASDRTMTQNWCKFKQVLFLLLFGVSHWHRKWQYVQTKMHINDKSSNLIIIFIHKDVVYLFLWFNGDFHETLCK